MASKFHQGYFTPKNPQKYRGKGKIMMRSSWEFKFAAFLDENENVLSWNSEGLRIPYFNPFKKKKTTYVPDFIMEYKDNTGKIVIELIEVKPWAQSVFEGKMNLKQKQTVALNHAKWEAARIFCKAKGITFRVVTEKDLFRQ